MTRLPDPITQAAAAYVEAFAARAEKHDPEAAETAKVIAKDLRNGFHLEDEVTA